MGDYELRSQIKEQLSSLKDTQGIYDLFRKLGYPEKVILDPSYTKKLADFEFAKEEKEKIRKIYTVMSYDKLNVFLIEADSLHKQFVRYVTKIFSDMYIQVLLIITKDYSEFQFIFPDYEKKEAGKHKLKTTVLNIRRDEIYYTDVEILCNLQLSSDSLTWRDVWRIWKDAFNVEKVTGKFFEDYKEIFLQIRKGLKKQKIETKVAHEFTLQFLNRIMFVYFISKKHWLNNDKKFMRTYWTLYKKSSKMGKDEFYSKWLQPLFFEAFNNKGKQHSDLPEEINRILSSCPYLNGGLFTKNEGLDDLNIEISDNLFKDIFEFFEKYNFTIKEDSLLDVEVAVDPQMIGYVYESLANVTEDVYEQEEDLRGDWGIFYTPRVEVNFMCRRSMVEYLANHTDIPKNELYEFVFDEDKENVEKKFNQKKCWGKIEQALDELSVVDPACGSGAFLVGMLNVLVELYKSVYKYTNASFTDFEMKYSILQRSLYGVDVMPWAIHAAELRLWLQLIVETQFGEDELRKHPLLPNLNMNLRVGDSLVQEIGGISFNVRANSLHKYLKKQLEALKQEKRKYFENSPTAKFKTPEEVKAEEIRLFEEIIEERTTEVQEQLELWLKGTKEKQTGLFGTELNKEAQFTKKVRETLEKTEKRIAALNEEIESLKKIKKLLKDPEQKPFVWEIDFAEIFGDKNGFDIVIGNPPYVRQEMISPPNREKSKVTLEDRGDYKEKLIKSVQNQFLVVENIDRKSDYYIYFYFHGIGLLNEKGTFCFITSNSWLDVGYGKELQEFLLKYVPIIAIYDNPKRSFAHAAVNTIIALFGAAKFNDERIEGLKVEGNNGWTMLQNTAKFVMFKKPFEEVLSAKNLIDIENIKAKIEGKGITELVKNVIKTNDYRTFPITQADLLDDGWEYPEDYKNGRFKAGSYEGNKWGGKYLRAPDIFYTILEKGKFCSLQDVSVVLPGCYSGINDFFYMNKEGISEWKIEKEFLIPIIRNSDIIQTLNVMNTRDNFVLSVPSVSKEELKGKKSLNLLSYISWGEKQVTRQRQKTEAGIPWNKVETVKNRKYWYSIPPKNLEPANLFMQYVSSDRFYCPYSDRKYVSDRCFHRIFVKKGQDFRIIASYLNSSIQAFFVMLFGRSNLGQGALKFEASDAKKIIIPYPKTDSKRLLNALDKLGKRKPLSIFLECGIDPLKPIREQEPKPLTDRAELDEVVFDELELTKEERKEVYWAVCELVKQRLDKAKSLETE